MTINTEENEVLSEKEALRDWLRMKGWTMIGDTLYKETDTYIHTIDIKKQMKED